MTIRQELLQKRTAHIKVYIADHLQNYVQMWRRGVGNAHAASSHARTHAPFPAPWYADKMPGGYGVRDANPLALVYIYGRANEAEARQAKVLTKDEARRIAVNIARLPALLGKADRN